jgi:hypothetical protein
MELVGLDVGFSETKSTSGVATLIGTMIEVGRATAAATSRHKLLASISKATVISIDAPLLPIVDARIRSCERLFARGKFQRRCKPGFSHVQGTRLQLRQAGFESAQQLQSLAFVGPLAAPVPLVLDSRNIVEAFPNAFLGVCISDEQY